MWRCFICCSLWPAGGLGRWIWARVGLWSMMLEEFGVFVAAAVPAVVLARVERSAVGSLRVAGAASVREIVLGGRGVGIR